MLLDFLTALKIEVNQLRSFRYDSQAHYVFAGLTNGEITVLKINKTDSELITTLKGHSSTISKCFLSLGILPVCSIIFGSIPDGHK